jgi:Tfp pilus assembly protein PilO
MNPVLRRWRESVEALGLAGVVGIALLVFAATLYGTAVAPRAAERAALQAEAERLRERLRMSGSPAGAKGTLAEQLATFYAFFPPAQSSPDWLGKIHAAAKAKGLVLQSGEYKLERSADARLARYQITLPVTGSYAQLRGFIGQVLTDVPAAALEEITLRRESVASPRLEARIRLTLYLGSA